MTKKELKELREWGKKEAVEINKMMSSLVDEEDIPKVFKSKTINRNWHNMVSLMYALFDDALLHYPDEYVFETYKSFAEEFDFDFHTELLGNMIDIWLNTLDTDVNDFNEILQLYSQIIYAVNYEIENKIHMIEEEEFSVIFNLYMDIIPYVMAASAIELF